MAQEVLLPITERVRLVGGIRRLPSTDICLFARISSPEQSPRLPVESGPQDSYVEFAIVLRSSAEAGEELKIDFDRVIGWLEFDDPVEDETLMRRVRQLERSNKTIGSAYLQVALEANDLASWDISLDSSLMSEPGFVIERHVRGGVNEMEARSSRRALEKFFKFPSPARPPF